MSQASKTRHFVAHAYDVPVGECKIVRVPAFGREIEIGIFNVHGRFVAYRNVCPHAGAPVCVGKICGTTAPSKVGEYHLVRSGEILRCPWHGWEFDLLNGEHLVDERMRLRGYEVETGAKNEDLEGFDVEQEGDSLFVLI